MIIELTSEQSLKVFEDVLEDESHEFIAKKVAEHLSVKDIIEPLETSEVLSSLDNGEVKDWVFEDMDISEDNVSLDFKGVRSLAHQTMIETIQKCLDQFVDPNKMIEKLEELL